jgi:hypothetical protein
MLRALAANFCNASSSAQSPNNLLLTLATPLAALFCEVTSNDARLSIFLPVHTEIDRSISTAEDEMEGVDIVGVDNAGVVGVDNAGVSVVCNILCGKMLWCCADVAVIASAYMVFLLLLCTA